MRGSDQISPTQGAELEVRLRSGIGLTVVLGLLSSGVDTAVGRPVTVMVRRMSSDVVGSVGKPEVLCGKGAAGGFK